MEPNEHSTRDGSMTTHSTTSEPAIQQDNDNEESTRKDNVPVQQPTPRTPSYSWSNARKWYAIFIYCLGSFLSGINATAVLSASDELAATFDIDERDFSYTYFLISSWNLAAAIVPVIVLPLMEDLGIRWIYIVMYATFFVFVIPQAVAQNFATLIVTRVFAGSCAGVLQNVVDGVAADVWDEDVHRRAKSLTVYIFCLLGGVTIGPVIGGAIIKSLDWRWISYIQLIIYGALFPVVVLTLPETRIHPGQSRAITHFREILSTTVLRAIRMLLTEFIVSSFTLWSSFAFGTVFLMTQSVPQVFTSLYGWAPWQTGVVQVAIFIGEFLGMLVCLVQDIYVYPRATANNPNPEARLYTSIPASFFGLTCGLFIYAWTSYSFLPWYGMAIGLGCVGFGIMAIVQAVSVYVTDNFTNNAASAISIVAFGENVFAAFLPLATKDMYNTLGFRWASSVLGFAALLLTAAPVILVLAGERIRGMSKYTG